MEFELLANLTEIVYEEDILQVYWTFMCGELEIENVYYKGQEIWDELPTYQRNEIYELLELSIDV